MPPTGLTNYRQIQRLFLRSFDNVTGALNHARQAPDTSVRAGRGQRQQRPHGKSGAPPPDMVMGTYTITASTAAGPCCPAARRRQWPGPEMDLAEFIGGNSPALQQQRQRCLRLRRRRIEGAHLHPRLPGGSDHVLGDGVATAASPTMSGATSTCGITKSSRSEQQRRHLDHRLRHLLLAPGGGGGGDCGCAVQVKPPRPGVDRRVGTVRRIRRLGSLPPAPRGA